MSDSSRRGFLVGSGAIATGSLTGLAGCLGDITGSGEDDEDQNDGRAPLPSFHHWLFAPETVGIGAYTYTYVDGEAAVNRSEYGPIFSHELGVWATETITSGALEASAIDDVDGAVSIDYRQRDGDAFGFAMTGGFDIDEMRTEYDEAVDKDDAVDAETYAGHDLYFSDEAAVAIDDGTFVLGVLQDRGLEANGRAIVEAMIDAQAGSATRLHAADTTAEMLLRQQGERTVVFGAPALQGDADYFFSRSARDTDEEDESDDAPRVAAGGFTLETADDRDRPSFSVTLITDRTVSDAEAFGDDVPALDRLPDPAVSQDGVVITYESGGDGTDGTESDDRKRSPQAGFDIDVDLESNTATVVHVGGDEIAADELRLICTGSGFRETWAALSNTATVSPGDRVSVPIAADDHGGGLLVQWTPESEILYAKSIPDGSSTTTEPAATFDFEFDFDQNTVRVRHTSGDDIPASEIELYFDSRERRGFQWDAVTDDEIVSAGDSAVLELTERDGGGTVVVIWSPDGSVLDYEYIPQSN